MKRNVLPASDIQASAIAPSILVDLANADRAHNGVAHLSSNPVLAAIAQAKANDMATKGYFAHTAPDGKTPWYWFNQENYQFSYAGENLAVGYSETEQVEEGWMNSPTHRANLLSTHFTEIGIAVALGTYEGRQAVYVAEEFGTPVRAAVATVRPKIVASTVPTPDVSAQSSSTPQPSVASATASPAPKPLSRPPSKAVAVAPRIIGTRDVEKTVLASTSPVVVQAAARVVRTEEIPVATVPPSPISRTPYATYLLSFGIAGVFMGTLARRKSLHRTYLEEGS